MYITLYLSFVFVFFRYSITKMLNAEKRCMIKTSLCSRYNVLNHYMLVIFKKFSLIFIDFEIASDVHINLGFLIDRCISYGSKPVSPADTAEI